MKKQLRIRIRNTLRIRMQKLTTYYPQNPSIRRTFINGSPVAPPLIRISQDLDYDADRYQNMSTSVHSFLSFPVHRHADLCEHRIIFTVEDYIQCRFYSTKKVGFISTLGPRRWVKTCVGWAEKLTRGRSRSYLQAKPCT